MLKVLVSLILNYLLAITNNLCRSGLIIFIMKLKWIICIILSLAGGCKNIPNNPEVASHFIDAFYSFDSVKLSTILRNAGESQPGILYYQKWAECGNYKIIAKHEFIEKNDSIMLCPITVKDDLIGALKIDFNVTDTFHLTIHKGEIRNVQTSSNDPEIYHEAKEWVKMNHPELVEEQCKGIWKRGTPCECVKGMISGYELFISAKKSVPVFNPPTEINQ